MSVVRDQDGVFDVVGFFAGGYPAFNTQNTVLVKEQTEGLE